MEIKLSPHRISATEFGFWIEVNGELKDFRIGYDRLVYLLKKELNEAD